MIVQKCDVCGKEIKRNCVSDRLILKRGVVMVEVVVGMGGTWNNGEICKECLLKVINKGEEQR